MSAARFPKVPIDTAGHKNGFYSDGSSQWDVARLWELTKDLPVFDCPLAGMDLSHTAWAGSSLSALAEHCKRVNEADLSKPIILDWDGAVADGRHRIVKALMLGKTTVKAVRMTYRPEPSRTENKS